MADLMISYAREDAAFVRDLHAALQTHGLSAWVDWNDIPPSAPVKQEIFDAIADAPAIVLALTPDWIESTYCRQEFDHALHLKKRLIPLLVRPVDETKTPPQLPDINWIRFDVLPFETGLQALLRAFHLDLERVRTHARLYRRAEAWVASRDSSILLRGAELANAERWVESAKEGEGAPAPIHLQYIVESRRAETSRQRKLLAGVSAALAITLISAVAVYFFYRSAEARRRTAQSRLLASEAVAREATQLDLSLLLSSHAFAIDPTVDARGALLGALVGHERLRRILHGAAGGVEAVAISADEAWIAAGDSSGRVLIWRRGTGAHYASAGPAEKDDIITAIAFSPSGASLVAGSMKNHVWIGDLSEGGLRTRASWEERAPVVSVAYSPDAGYIAVGDYLGTVRVYDANANPLPGAPAFAFQPDSEAPVMALAFSVSSRLLAIGRGSQRISVHSLDSGEQQPVVIDQGGRIAGLAFASNDGVVMAAGDQRIAIWDLSKPNQPAAESPAADRILSFDVSPDGRRLIVGLNNGDVQTVDLRSRTAHLFRGNRTPVRSVALRGDTVVSGGADGSVMLWSADETSSIAIGAGVHRSSPTSIAFDPSGKSVVSGDLGGTLATWDLAGSSVSAESLRREVEGIDALAFSRDGRLLAIASEDSGLLLWDTAKRKEIRPADASLKGTVVAAFGSTSARVTVFGADGRGAVVESNSGAKRSCPEAPAIGRPMSAAVDAGRSRIAIGTNDGFIGFADLATGCYQGSPHRIRASEVMGVVYIDATHVLGALTDGDLFVSGSGAETPRFIPTGLKRLTALAYSPVLRIAATGNHDGVIQLWDTESWRQIGPGIAAHLQSVQALAFSPDGLTLASNGGDGQIRMWVVDPRRWAGAACAIANRQLSGERGLFDLRDAPDCKPGSPNPPWPRPVYPDGFSPVRPKPVEATAGRAIG